MRTLEIGLTFMLLTASCEADWRDEYDFAWYGENVTLYAYGHSKEEVCGGSFAELDGHIAMIERDLGIENGPIHTYRWLSDDSWNALGDANPCLEHGACAPAGTAMSRWLPHMHEAVHAITHHAARCPRLLDEGLAMYYDGSSPTSDGDYPWNWISIVDLLENGLGGATHGPTVGRALHFTNFLAEIHGPPSILELCRLLPTDVPSIAAWEDAIRKVYGITLEQLIAEYDAYPECSYANMSARLWGCGGRRDFTFWAPGSEYVVETGCDDPQATNAWGKAVLTRRIYLFDDMKLRVSSNTIGVGPNAVHAIQQCGPCSKDPDVFVEITDDPYDYETRMYRAGLHEVTVEFDPATNVRLSIMAED
jgi:hypothetical protein